MEKKIKKYEKKFKELDYEKLGLEQGEQLVHCLDAQSFEGKYYAPEWAASNYGRAYSLAKNKWLAPQAIGTNRAYWGFKGHIQPKVHQLVLNYFPNESDKTALKFFGEKNVEGHHIIPIEIPEELKVHTEENKLKRMEHCMKCNRKSNVVYQEKQHDHKDDTRITNGIETEGEQHGKEVWSSDMILFRSIASNSGKREGNSNGSYYVYSEDENGNLKRELKMVLNMKGSI